MSTVQHRRALLDLALAQQDEAFGIIDAPPRKPGRKPGKPKPAGAQEMFVDEAAGIKLCRGAMAPRNDFQPIGVGEVASEVQDALTGRITPELARYLVEVREWSGLTQQQVADKIGVGVALIGKVERDGIRGDLVGSFLAACQLGDDDIEEALKRQ